MTSLPEGITESFHPKEWEFTDLSGTRFQQPNGGRPMPQSPAA
jgi:hypothetical protein